jgi:chromosome segregation ATPase
LLFLTIHHGKKLSKPKTILKKDDIEEKEKLIEELEGYLAELGAELDELNTIALIKNEEYNQAVEEVNILTRRVDSLKQEVSEATEEAESVKLQLGRMAARMYRDGTSGNNSLELFFNPESADCLQNGKHLSEKPRQASKC